MAKQIDPVPEPQNVVGLGGGFGLGNWASWGADEGRGGPRGGGDSPLGGGAEGGGGGPRGGRGGGGVARTRQLAQAREPENVVGLVGEFGAGYWVKLRARRGTREPAVRGVLRLAS